MIKQKFIQMSYLVESNRGWLLARALVNNPSMIIADEPTGNLDPDTAWEIMTLLNDINARGTTVVVATHAKDIVDRMKKRVIQIERWQYNKR